jgi:hypothetical protein
MLLFCCCGCDLLNFIAVVLDVVLCEAVVSVGKKTPWLFSVSKLYRLIDRRWS